MENFAEGQQIHDQAEQMNGHFRLDSGTELQGQHQDSLAHRAQKESSDDAENERCRSQKSLIGGGGHDQSGARTASDAEAARTENKHQRSSDTTSVEAVDPNTRRPGGHAERGDVIEKSEFTGVSKRCPRLAKLLQVYTSGPTLLRSN